MRQAVEELPAGCAQIAASDAEPRRRLAVEIVMEGGDWSAFEPLEPAIQAAAQAVAGWRGLLSEPAQAVVALSSDAQIRLLNRNFRRQDKPTNVLSFPVASGTRDPATGVMQLGDVILAAETVAREAEEQVIPLLHHVQHLVVHGLLHLLGHDHVDDREAEVMESLEVAILARLGVPSPYE